MTPRTMMMMKMILKRRCEVQISSRINWRWNKTGRRLEQVNSRAVIIMHGGLLHIQARSFEKRTSRQTVKTQAHILTRPSVCSHSIWATARWNQQNDLCTQTQIGLGIYPGWSESSLGTQVIPPRLIWVFIGHTHRSFCWFCHTELIWNSSYKEPDLLPHSLCASYCTCLWSLFTSHGPFVCLNMKTLFLLYWPSLLAHVVQLVISSFAYY